MRGAGQCVLNTGEYVHVGMLCSCSHLLIWAGGKEKDRVTTQFCSTLTGSKCLPMIIFKAQSAMFPLDGKMPRVNTIAAELQTNRFLNGTSYPEGMILDCNPTAYALQEQLMRTVNEQMLNIPNSRLSIVMIIRDTKQMSLRRTVSLSKGTCILQKEA